MHDNVDRARYTLAIVIALLERPVAENEPTLRDVLLSLKMFAAEGQLDEMKVILGWLLDTRRLRIALPPAKVIAWKSTIQDILDDGDAPQPNNLKPWTVG